MKSKKMFSLERKVEVIKTFFLSKRLRKEALRLAAEHIYSQTIGRRFQKLPSISLKELVPSPILIELAPFPRINGNLLHYELIVLASLVKFLKPKNLLEIGTFNGLSTLHLALNAPLGACVHTLDITHLEDHHHLVYEEDKRYILDPNKVDKKYYQYECPAKIIEHEGNSFVYPFSSFDASDFVFIDGGHSYENVKNDTERSLNILTPSGCILWHDYGPSCPGVFRYLNSIAHLYPIYHIEGTAFAYLKKSSII